MADRATVFLGPQPFAAPVTQVSNRPPARPPALSSPPDALGLLKALRRRWPWALFGGLLSALVAGAGASLFMPPMKYKARSMIYVSSQRPKEIFDTRESVSDYKTFQETQTILVTSHTVLSAALKNPAIAQLPATLQQEDPVAWLGDKVRVDFARGSEILSISVTDQDPKESASLVNAVTDAYLKQI
ncbi:MAG TPA: Wzz/FepE/Etk N-terminal domain-containing protein, partial [Isosphaeraceae bacterium]|nr:Wzz/FepE/Etk N-terminal domain-containing protein [Isosphaeraceae bacterium]